MTHYTYLLVDFFTIIVPFLFSFHPKLQFYKQWKAFAFGTLVSGIWFVLWDSYYTKLGVWGFTEQYLIGTKIINLPIEEILFFICIPYSCMFTFHCLDKLTSLQLGNKVTTWASISLCLIFVLGLILFYDRAYTAYTCAVSLSLVILSQFVFKVDWLNRFYWIYGVLLLPFFIVNGVLTGTGLEQPVVWYNNNENLGIRLLTIPVEDIFYGMSMILMNLLVYKKLTVIPRNEESVG